MKEHGICAKCKKSVGCPYADDRITGCKNFVLEPELKLTNEESLRQCNTEQLAEWLVEVTQYCFECGLNTNNCVFCPFGKCIDKGFAMEWLKQPHKDGESWTK